MDAMSVQSTDPETGETYPPYYSFNDANHLPPNRKTPSEEPLPQMNAIIYDIKANATNTPQIHANFFSQIANSSTSFLAPERIMKDKLLATKKGQKMDLFTRREYLLPYEMTSRLIDEINNLKLKPTGTANQINVEQISRSVPKDRFSATEYALWRIKYYEDKALRKNKKKLTGKFAFYSPKNSRG